MGEDDCTAMTVCPAGTVRWLPEDDLASVRSLAGKSIRIMLWHFVMRYKPWESLWSSSATTPLVDFHHRLTACPSYIRKAPSGCSGLS